MSYKPVIDVRDYDHLIERLRALDAQGLGGIRKDELMVLVN